MEPKLNRDAVQNWLKGQREAQKVIERERREELRKRTPEESLRIYLELKEASPDDPNRTDISPVLWAMRQAAKKLAERGVR
jgi:hypothetical protein